MSSQFIKPAKKPNKKNSDIPEDLKNKWGAVEAAATTFSVIQKGMWTHEWHTNVKNSLMWVAKLHEQCVESALEHPKADLIPELKKLKEEQEKKNDEANTAAN